MSRCRDNINLPRMRAEARMCEVQLGASQRRVSVLTDISSLHSFALKCLQEYFGTLYRISLGNICRLCRLQPCLTEEQFGQSNIWGKAKK